jgi:hypothetical protein
MSSMRMHEGESLQEKQGRVVLDGVRDIDVEREIGLGGNNAKRKEDTRQGYGVKGEDRDQVRDMVV